MTRTVKRELLIDGTMVYLALKLFKTSNNLRQQKKEVEKRIMEELKQQEELRNKIYTYTFKESALNKIRLTMQGLVSTLSSNGIEADEALLNNAYDIIHSIEVLQNMDKEELTNGNEA